MELFEKARKVRISACRRAPAHMRDLGVLAGQIHGEYLKSDIDHARRRAEQIARKIVVLFEHRAVGVLLISLARPTGLEPVLPP